MSALADHVNNAEYRAALGSIHFNASNFQVFTFIIGITFLLGLSFLIISLVVIQSEDQSLNQRTLWGLAAADGIVLILLAIQYFNYLRNIGKYIYARIRPVTTKMTKCKRRSTGTSSARIPTI